MLGGWLIHPGTARDLLGYVAFASYSAELPLLIVFKIAACRETQRDTEREREGERALNQLCLQQALILGCTRASASSIYRSCKLLQLIYKLVANCRLHDELDMAAILDPLPPHAWKLLLRFKRFYHKFCLTLIQWVIFFFFIQEDPDRRMSKQNLDMIRNIAGDLHAKYYSSIMTFVQQNLMPAGIIVEARGIPAEAAAWSSLNCRY